MKRPQVICTLIILLSLIAGCGGGGGTNGGAISDLIVATATPTVNYPTGVVTPTATPVAVQTPVEPTTVPTSAPTVAPTGTPVPAKVKVTVYDVPSYAPATGAQVAVSRDGFTTINKTTDSKGECEFEVPAEGSWHFKVTWSGSSDERDETITVTQSGTPQSVVFHF